LNLLIIVLLLIALFPRGPLNTSIIQETHATAQAVSLVGYASTGWEAPDGTVNPTITIPHGELLNLTSSSGDGALHEFYVDVDGNGVRDYPVDPAEVTNSKSTLGYFPPGTYTYYCSFHPGTMHGTFNVLPPPGSNFAITPNWWLSVIVHGSQSTSTTITVSSLNGFSGAVNLSPPDAPAGITATLSKSIVSINPSTPGTTVLNLTAGPSTPQGKYTVTLTGSDGTGSQTASITTLVYQSNFQLSGTPNLPVPLGSSRNDTITVISTWGFYGDITLATAVSPLGPRVFLNMTRVSITPFKFAHVLLTVDAAGIQQGDYNVTITGSSSPSLSHQLVYHVFAWPERTSVSQGGVINPEILTIIGVSLLLIAVIVLSALWVQKSRKEPQVSVESETTAKDSG